MVGCPLKRREKARPLFERHDRVPSLFPKRSNQALRPGASSSPNGEEPSGTCGARAGEGVRELVSGAHWRCARRVRADAGGGRWCVMRAADAYCLERAVQAPRPVCEASLGSMCSTAHSSSADGYSVVSRGRRRGGDVAWALLRSRSGVGRLVEFRAVTVTHPVLQSPSPLRSYTATRT